MNRLLVSLTALVMLLALGTGCRSLTGKSLGQNIDDKTTTASVKAKLVGERWRNITSLDVDTNQGVVYLSGNVPTAEHKAEAERLARETTGVKRVVNNLMVPQPSGTAGTPAASPATGDSIGRHSMTGEVTLIERDKGHIHLKTAEGEFQLSFPPSAVRNVQQGDRITVDLVEMNRAR